MVSPLAEASKAAWIVTQSPDPSCSTDQVRAMAEYPAKWRTDKTKKNGRCFKPAPYHFTISIRLIMF